MGDGRPVSRQPALDRGRELGVGVGAGAAAGVWKSAKSGTLVVWYSSYETVTYGPSALPLVMATGLRLKPCENSELDGRHAAKDPPA